MKFHDPVVLGDDNGSIWLGKSYLTMGGCKCVCCILVFNHGAVLGTIYSTTQLIREILDITYENIYRTMLRVRILPLVSGT